MVEGMPNGFSRVIELSGDLSDGHAIAPSPPNRAVVIHRKHFLCLRASEPIPVGTFTIHGCARVGPSYALILPPGGSLFRAHFHRAGGPAHRGGLLRHAPSRIAGRAIQEV